MRRDDKKTWLSWRRRSSKSGGRAAHTLQPSSPGAWRLWLVLAVLVVATGVVFARAFYLEAVDHTFLAEQGAKRFVRTETLQAYRGAILDRRGKPLALSAPVDSIWVVPGELLKAPRYLPALAQLMQTPLPRFKAFLHARDDRQFVYLKRQIPPQEGKRFMALGAPGLFSQREYRRYYPAGAVTAQIVGFTGIDGHGQAGIELAYNKLLSGVNGSRRVIRNRIGQVVGDVAGYKAAKPGEDIHLSIDLRLQYIAYRDLKEAVQSANATSGMMVVVDATNGQILAMVSQPSFNPNRVSDRTSTGLRDRPVMDVLEPGSTVKPLLISTALEHDVITPQTRINTGAGWFMVDGMTINDDEANGIIDIAQLLQKSSNIGAAKVGLKMGPKLVWQGYHNFGLGRPVDIGLPGTANGVLRPWSSWGQIATATASYGYGVSVTALQLARAYCTIADNGLMPHLSIVMGGQPIPPRRVIPAAVAKTVRQMLIGVVSPEGTAENAAVGGYLVAGKTGTSRIASGGGYAKGQYHALFAGMLPAKHPRLVGVVVINSPSGNDYYGGSVAAPVFSRVMEVAARMLQIAPDQWQSGAETQAAAVRLEKVRS